jgi:hypothetical protein
MAVLEQERLLRDNPQSYSIRMIVQSDPSITCAYDCTDASEYVVQGEVGSSLVTFVTCRECLKGKGIYPIEDGWVDDG